MFVLTLRCLGNERKEKGERHAIAAVGRTEHGTPPKLFAVITVTLCFSDRNRGDAGNEGHLLVRIPSPPPKASPLMPAAVGKGRKPQPVAATLAASTAATCFAGRKNRGGSVLDYGAARTIEREPNRERNPAAALHVVDLQEKREMAGEFTGEMGVLAGGLHLCLLPAVVSWSERDKRLKR
nr:hypothetical protein Iba_chr05cCG11430 [Ipomoea batatas]